MTTITAVRSGKGYKYMAVGESRPGRIAIPVKSMRTFPKRADALARGREIYGMKNG